MQKAIATAALLLFAAAAARALTSGYEARREQLAADAEAQRKKLNLPPAKLYAQYPTPEVSLQGEAPQVACGGTATVKLTGKAPKGTTFLFSDDDVQVVEQKTLASGWQASVKIAASATPRDVNVHAIAPVTGAEASQRALLIRGRYQLELKFEDGWTARFATTSVEDNDLGGDLSWKKGEAARATPARISWSDGKLRLQWERSQEEIDGRSTAAGQLQSLGGEAAVQKAMARVEACMKKADPARGTCMEAAEKQNDAEMEVLKKKMDAAVDAAEAKLPRDAWGCSEAQLESAAGALSGTATCPPKERKVKVTGTLKCLGAASGE